MPELPAPLVAADLWVALFALAPTLLLGVPALRAGVRQPAELALEPLAEEALGARARRWLDAHERQLGELGYRRVGTWRLVGMSRQTALMRAWWSDADPAVAVASLLLDQRDGVESGTAWLEFQTEFAQGPGVNTSNLRRSWLQRRIAHEHAFGAPGASDARALHAVHERNCAPHRVRGARFLRPEAFVPAYLDGWRRSLAHQRAIGFLRPLPDGSNGLTLRGALWGLLDTFSPLFGAVALPKLALALALGLAPPALALSGALAAADPFAGRGLLAAGVESLGMGLLLRGRAYLWAPLLCQLGLRLAGGGLESGVLLVGASQVCAIAGHNLASRLEARL
jgi:hypothetical protein